MELPKLHVTSRIAHLLINRIEIVDTVMCIVIMLALLN
jgi:hypothetical protein